MLEYMISGKLNEWKDFLKKNRDTMLFCLVTVFVWGMMAHGYAFLHSSFSHDSLNEFNSAVYGNAWKIQLGRGFVPVYRTLVRGDITMPWLIGILSLLFVGGAVFFVVKIFEIKSKFLTVLIAGVFTVNLTMTATIATYIHDFDCDMIALLFSVFAVYLWKRYDKGFLLGVVPVCFSLGVYQSYISVTITLVMLYLILALMNGMTFKTAFLKGLKSVMMLLGGVVCYLGFSKVVSVITGNVVISGSYNSIDTVLFMTPIQIFKTAIEGYWETINILLTAKSIYPEKLRIIIHSVMIAFVLLVILYRLCTKEIHWKEKLLAVTLLFLLPVGMNTVYILTGGMSHDLMYYAIWLFYLFVLLLGWDAIKYLTPFARSASVVRVLSVFMVFVILWGNVQTSNMAYLKKDLEQQANLSMFTRILYRIEDYEGYQPVTTPVVFAERPDLTLRYVTGFEEIYKITGSWEPYVLGGAVRSCYEAYFHYVLHSTVRMADTEIWEQMQSDSRVAEMPRYPDKGCVDMIDGVLVVKLG